MGASPTKFNKVQQNLKTSRNICGSHVTVVRLSSLDHLCRESPQESRRGRGMEGEGWRRRGGGGGVEEEGWRGRGGGN